MSTLQNYASILTNKQIPFSLSEDILCASHQGTSGTGHKTKVSLVITKENSNFTTFCIGGFGEDDFSMTPENAIEEYMFRRQQLLSVNNN